MSPLGFKARVGFFCIGECNVHSLRSTSGATCADLLVVSTQLVISHRRRMRYHCASDMAIQGYFYKAFILLAVSH